MKPSWDDAPEWAEWLAQYHDGDWYWFERRPSLDEWNSWDTEFKYRRKYAGYSTVKLTLEHRPE